MKKIIFLSVIIISIFLSNNTSVFACEQISSDYYKYLTLEETIASSTNIVIAERTLNNQISPEGFPVTSQYDWLELNVIQTLKGNLLIDSKIKIKTAEMCGYGTYYSDDMEIGKKYLIFLGTKPANDLWLPVVSNFLDGSDQYRGLRQYEINGENILGLNITVNELKNKISGVNGPKIYSVSEFQDFIENNKETCSPCPQYNTCTQCTPFMGKIFDGQHDTRGYVIRDEQVPINCPVNPDGTMRMCTRPIWHRFLIINDSVKAKDGLKIMYGKYERGEFKIGEEYIFKLNIQKSNGTLYFDSYYLSSNPPTSKSSLLGSKDLKLGSNSPEVKILQEILNNNGFLITASGAGSLGNETTYFGNLTKQALIRFQQKYNIAPAVGYFGTITREKMKSLGM